MSEELFNQSMDPEDLLEQQEVFNEGMNRKYYVGPDLTRKRREMIQGLFDVWLNKHIGDIDEELTIASYKEKMNNLHEEVSSYVALLEVKIPKYAEKRFEKAKNY